MMNTKTIEMPDVSGCDASGCAYNTANGCRARAITIGDGAFPGCDTFLGGADNRAAAPRTAGVGACKVAVCKYNKDFECEASAIVVAAAGAPPACQTFAA
jgi:hypothetical protein